MSQSMSCPSPASPGGRCPPIWAEKAQRSLGTAPSSSPSPAPPLHRWTRGSTARVGAGLQGFWGDGLLPPHGQYVSSLALKVTWASSRSQWHLDSNWDLTEERD